MLFNWKLFPGTNLQDLNLDWIINFVKMIPSRLPKFSDHHTWLVYDYSTGEYYDSGEPTGGAGEPGEPGKSPIIGTNGDWYTWNTETETYTDTGTRAQGVQGEPGAGVAAGGAAGDVLVKASGVDYNTGWTATPPQMGAIASINAGNSAVRMYNQNDLLVYNGKLYYAKINIAQDTLLDASENGNIKEITIAEKIPKLTLYSFTAVSVPVGGNPTWISEQISIPNGDYLVFASVIPDATYTQGYIQCRIYTDVSTAGVKHYGVGNGNPAQGFLMAHTFFRVGTHLENASSGCNCSAQVYLLKI